MMKSGKLIESPVWDFEISNEIFQKFAENKRKRSHVARELGKTQETFRLNNPKNQREQKIAIPDKSLKKPVEISIFGQVRAGTTLGPDDLIVDLSPSGDTILLPDIDDGQEIFVLEVQGRSMESDAILPNDYVIVERVSFPMIKDGDLIVAKYLKEEFNFVSEDDFDIAISDESNFAGPTLKYFRQISVNVGKDIKGKSVNEIRYMLAPRNKDKRYTIETRYIDPQDLGRVVSIHRAIRRL